MPNVETAHAWAAVLVPATTKSTNKPLFYEHDVNCTHTKGEEVAFKGTQLMSARFHSYIPLPFSSQTLICACEVLIYSLQRSK